MEKITNIQNISPLMAESNSDIKNRSFTGLKK